MGSSFYNNQFKTLLDATYLSRSLLNISLTYPTHSQFDIIATPSVLNPALRTDSHNNLEKL
jgi:hypothetical protein